MGTTVTVLYEDDGLIAFDKPSGLLVIPAPGKDPNTLTHIVNKEHQSLGGMRLHPCHRLDQETSGVILYAKGKRHQQMMMTLFHQQGIRKKYIAFVKGQVKQKTGSIKGFIQDHTLRRYGLKPGIARHLPRGKMAITCYQVEGIRKSFSIVEVYPQTGRTHQIRIHFKGIGHPLLGERIYAFRKDFLVNFKRLALHASELKFIHPVSKKEIIIRSDLPEDMRKFLDKFN